MKSGTQVALAVGAGYLLGRRRRLRLAMLLGIGAMTGGLGGIPGQLVRRGTKLVGSSLGSSDMLSKVSPEISELTGIIRGDLIDAGKDAAVAAMSSRIDSLSDRLHDRAESWRHPGDGEAATGARGEDEEAEDEEAEEGAEGEAALDEGAEEEGVGEPQPAASRRAPRPEPRGSGKTPAGRRAERGGDTPDEERPARVRRPARTAAAAAPVRRTRR